MFGLIPFEKRNGELRSFNDLLAIDRVFEDFFNDHTFPVLFGDNDRMRVDVKDNGQEYIVEAELPGVKKEEINVELVDGRLRIAVQKNEETEEKQESYLRKERRSSSMVRSFMVKDVADDNITAKFENGLLTLVLPRKEENTPSGKKIDVH